MSTKKGQWTALAATKCHCLESSIFLSIGSSLLSCRWKVCYKWWDNLLDSEFWSLNRVKTKSIWASLPDLWTSMWLNSFITRLTDSARRPTGSMWQPRAEAGNVRQVLLFCGNSSRCVIRMATIMIMWCDAHDKRWIHTPRWPPSTTPTYPKPPSVVVCKHVRAKATASCQLRVESPQGHVAARQMGQRQQQQQQQRQRPLVHAT